MPLIRVWTKGPEYNLEKRGADDRLSVKTFFRIVRIWTSQFDNTAMLDVRPSTNQSNQSNIGRCDVQDVRLSFKSLKLSP